MAFDAGGFLAAFGGSRFIDATDGLGMGVLLGHDLLAAIPQLPFIPNQRFQKPLQGARRRVLSQRNRFRILALHVREQTADVDR